MLSRRCALGMFFVPLLAACGPRPEDEPAPVVGRRAPDFTLPDLDGRPVTLRSYLGTPLVLNFYATWCGPCRFELPAFQEIATRYVDRGLRFLLIDLQEEPADVRRFLDELKVSLPSVIDETGEVTKLFRVRGLPATFFLDRGGVIRAAQLGALDERLLEMGVGKIL